MWSLEVRWPASLLNHKQALKGESDASWGCLRSQKHTPQLPRQWAVFKYLVNLVPLFTLTLLTVSVDSVCCDGILFFSPPALHPSSSVRPCSSYWPSTHPHLVLLTFLQEHPPCMSISVLTLKDNSGVFRPGWSLWTGGWIWHLNMGGLHPGHNMQRFSSSVH